PFPWDASRRRATSPMPRSTSPPTRASSSPASRSKSTAAAASDPRRSVPEVAHAGEDHGDAGLVGGGDHFIVAQRAARLNDRGGAGGHGGFETIGKGKERIRCDDRTLRRAGREAGGASRFLGLPGGD